MIHIVFASTACHQMSESEWEYLLAACRRKNAVNNISGLLLHKNGYYMQVLEGPEDNIIDIYSMIRQDPKHKSIMTLRVEPILHRSFAESPLSFHDLDLEAPPPLLKPAKDANKNFTPDYFKGHTNEAFRLLLAFVNNPDKN